MECKVLKHGVSQRPAKGLKPVECSVGDVIKVSNRFGAILVSRGLVEAAAKSSVTTGSAKSKGRSKKPKPESVKEEESDG